MKTKIIESENLEDTIIIGNSIGKNLKGSEIIELIGDLGSGKTTLVKAITFGAIDLDIASSPSFSLINEYSGKLIKIYHVDFYRLSPDQDLIEQINEVIKEPNSVLLIEWPKQAIKLLPKNRINISISPIGLTKRRIVIKYPSDYEYLFSDN